ncbi:MAG: (d)CMP kinase [Oscillospiraceae bacterium]|nr:(d)CMP kinase [Oscillospiraceae bacterium]
MGNIIAIDGPAGAGKGVISKRLANEIGFDNFDTGALYRCVSLQMLRTNINLNNIDEIVKIAKEMNVVFKKDGEDESVFLDGEDVTKAIREDNVNSIVSEVSTIKELREQILIIQRELVKGKNIVVEGRDIGTCVFPNAKIKIYLDASLEERANRRYKENLEKGINTTYEETLELLRHRDKIDMTREVAPLRKADDAVVVDTTELTIDEVVDRIKEIVG